MSAAPLTADQIALLEKQLQLKEQLRGNPAASFLAINQLEKAEFDRIMQLAHAIKARPEQYLDALKGKKIALLFQKTSTRTKESFLTGAHELGMMASYIDWQKSNFTLSELEDEIKVLSQWYDVIMARVYDHQDLLTMRAYSEVPVINGLCNFYHPCQALADLQTIQEYFGISMGNLKLTYVGDGNNVCNSLIEAAALAGIGDIAIATPALPKHQPLAQSLEFARQRTHCAWMDDVAKAVEGANIVYTDTWVSMGQEAETREREAIFHHFRITGAVMAKASPHCIFMHDMPAHPGKEVDADVLRGYRSVVFQQAQNRKHAQKALLYHMLAS
ncbi:MAG: ornithine carbamoyltransferase [Alphaproteobacteria bacterium]